MKPECFLGNCQWPTATPCFSCSKDPKNNPVLARLMKEVEIEKVEVKTTRYNRTPGYNRVHNRHNRG